MATIRNYKSVCPLSPSDLLLLLLLFYFLLHPLLLCPPGFFFLSFPSLYPPSRLQQILTNQLQMWVMWLLLSYSKITLWWVTATHTHTSLSPCVCFSACLSVSVCLCLWSEQVNEKQTGILCCLCCSFDSIEKQLAQSSLWFWLLYIQTGNSHQQNTNVLLGGYCVWEVWIIYVFIF